MRNVSRLRLRAHTLKVEAAAWHEDGSAYVMTSALVKMSKMRCTLFYFQDHRACELRRKHFSFLFTAFGGLLSSSSLLAATGQQPTS